MAEIRRGVLSSEVVEQILELMPAGVTGDERFARGTNELDALAEIAVDQFCSRLNIDPSNTSYSYKVLGERGVSITNKVHTDGGRVITSSIGSDPCNLAGTVGIEGPGLEPLKHKHNTVFLLSGTADNPAACLQNDEIDVKLTQPKESDAIILLPGEWHCAPRLSPGTTRLLIIASDDQF